MKKITFTLIILLSILTLYSQHDTKPPQITLKQDSLPVLTVSCDIETLAKITVKTILARTSSKIIVNNTTYKIEYDKSIYTVWSHINNAKYIPEQLFTSTRVTDVREFMRKEIIAFYENYH